MGVFNEIYKQELEAAGWRAIDAHMITPQQDHIPFHYIVLSVTQWSSYDVILKCTYSSSVYLGFVAATPGGYIDQSVYDCDSPCDQQQQ